MGKRRSSSNPFGDDTSISSCSPPNSKANRESSPSRKAKSRGHSATAGSPGSSMAHLSIIQQNVDDLAFSPPEDDWVSRAYQKLNVPQPGMPTRCEYIVTAALLAVSAALGGLLVVVGALERYHPVVLLCPNCEDVVVSVVVVGAALMLAVLLGSVGTYWRLRVCSASAVVLFACLGIAFMALFGFVFAYRVSPNLPGFEDLWQRAVLNDPALVCAIQSDLRCSGFRYGCCVTNHSAFDRESALWEPATYNDSGICYATLGNGSALSLVGGAVEVVTWPSRVCSSRCAATEKQLCSKVLESRVDAYAVYLLVVLFLVAVLQVVAAVFVCKAGFRPPPPPERIFLLAASDE